MSNKSGKSGKNTMKIALFRQTKCGFIAIFNLDEGKDESWTMLDYVRVSQWKTVEFDMLPPDETAAAEMAALSELRAETVDEFAQKLSYIDGRIANLRALTGPVTP